jgi:Fic family protein
MTETRNSEILNFIEAKPGCSSKQIHDHFSTEFSYATVKRVLTSLAGEKLIIAKGLGKGTKYFISPAFEVFRLIDIDDYYKKEIDERTIKADFNFSIFDLLADHDLFTEHEMAYLSDLQEQFSRNISQLTPAEYQKEFERLAIDLSWKSSQIEGNTYSLLETERLLKEKETASGKTQAEAIMLLNHKEAIDFIMENPDYLIPVSIAKIEDIHRMLTSGLGIDFNLRKRRIGISGTNYRPLDNEFQILEAVGRSCEIVNRKENIFEKAMLILLLLSYIQPFMDGNKRTARIVSNAVLINCKYCPISFRTVDSVDYKKAMLLFYEQNNISGFRKIFIDQFAFAVNTYF